MKCEEVALEDPKARPSSIAVLALAGATLSAALAAPKTQEAPPSDAPGIDVAAEHPPNKPSHAYLGLLTQQLKDRDREVLGVPDEVEGGLLVIGSVPGSPAEEAGLQRGDVILSVNGTTLTNPRELDRLVKSMSPSEEIEVVYWRDGERHTVGIILGDRTDHCEPPVPAWLNQLHKFMDMFPNAVDTSVIIKGNHRIELADLVEDIPVVVLEIDGTVKAVVVSRHLTDTGRVRSDGIDEVKPNPRKASGGEIRRHMKELREEFKQGRDRNDIGETIEKLHERIEELQARLGEAGDSDGGDDDDDSNNRDSGEGAAA